MKSKRSKLKLLLWKNYLLQRRNPYTTILELVIPILFALLLLVIRARVTPEIYDNGMQYEPLLLPNTTDLDELRALMGALLIPKPIPKPQKGSISKIKPNLTPPPTRNIIYYFPNTSFLNDLMENANNALGWDLSISGLAIENELKTKLIENLAFVGIKFLQKKQSENLEYEIIFPGELVTKQNINPPNPLLYNWYTNRLFAKFDTGARNHNETISGKVDGTPSGYYEEGFLSIQQAIFAALLRMKSPDGFNLMNVPRVTIQRFPVVPFIYDKLHAVLQAVFPIFILLCFVYPCINIIKYITTEKEKQLKEAMKIMGLDSWLHWTAWFVKCLVYMIITVTLITALCKLEIANVSVFTKSSFSVIWMFLFIYSITTITFCFMLSVFFSKASTAAAVGGLTWFLIYSPYFFIKNRYETMNFAEKLFICLLSNTGMSLGFNVVQRHEATQVGMQWEYVFNSIDADDNFTLGYVWIMLIIDALIYLLIALYIEKVFPGDYGVPEKWNFPFTKSFWIRKIDCVELEECNPISCGDSIEMSDSSEFESSNFEIESNTKKVGIKIINLRKVYDNKIAVDGLNLNLCENEITVLLGHNGAGKSTTMSILTGMIRPTSGTAIIEGKDIRTDMDFIRSSIGFCPQHDILFDNLTVKDHITFYALLKGMSNREVEDEVMKYVRLLKLEPKINTKSKDLSGGMKRKLSVAIALCGNSKVVFFDEASSGVDPGARRDLLELIQKEKKGRTILLSTHFMQDAEVLGDRIAIMANGQLKAVGTPFFLKKQFGEGYRLVCVKKNSNVGSDEVTRLLQRYIPDIHKESEIGTELSYCMNEKNVGVFQEMLQDLEENAERLNIDSYGISLTTLEEVFMKIGADNNHEKCETSSSSTIDLSEECENELIQNNFYEYADSLALLTGVGLFLNQLCAMMAKKILTSKRSFALTFIQFLIPVLCISITILVVRTWQGGDLKPIKLDLRLYQDTFTTLKFNGNSSCDGINTKIFHEYQKQFNEFPEANLNLINENIINYYWKMSSKSLIRANNRYLFGATIGPSNITMHFNNRPYHSTPISLSLIHNAILRAVTGRNIEIKVWNAPLKYRGETNTLMASASNSLGFQLSFNLGFAMSFVASFFVISYVKERKSKAKHLQFVSGINPITYWLTAFVWDFIIFTLIASVIIATFAVFHEKGFATYEELKRVYYILLLFGFSVLPTVYISSFFFETPAGGFIKMSMAYMFVGAALFMLVFTLRSFDENVKKLADALAKPLMIVPHFSLCLAINNFNVNNVRAEAATIRCDNYKICNQTEMHPDYHAWEEPGIGRNNFFFIMSGIFSFCLLFMIEFRVFEIVYYFIRHKLLVKLFPKIFKETKKFGEVDEEGDYDVLTEKEKINNMERREYEDYSLIMKNVSRYYKDFQAVNKLCVGIKPGEAFGLLGVNGAGKTSTFKMLSGDIKISEGEAYVNGISLKMNMKKVHKITGYCPQFDALIDNLTGRETLRLFAMSRGVPKNRLNDIIRKIAEDFNFTKHLDKRVKAYSGGNRRKLSTAVAILGNPVIIYLDEPTTGMDLASKRNLWDVVCNVRNAGKTIVLTSHSMEECEALCTRLVIMVNGQFKCIGSIQHLKSKFGQGFDLVVKLKRLRNAQLVEKEKDEVKEFISQEFAGAQLREEYYDLMAFRVPSKNLKWSKIFGKLQEAKSRLHIEDYSIAQASLEQVFLSFTMYQREENN